MKIKLLLIFFWGASFNSFTQTTSDSLEIDSLNNAAWSFIRTDPPKCLKKAKQVFKLAKRRGYSRGSMKAMITCGSAFLLQGQQDSSVYYYNKAMVIAVRSNNLKGQASIHNNFGSLYRSQGLYQIALNHFEKSLQLKKKLKVDSCKIANGYINIGNLFVSMEEFEKAIQLFIRAQDYITDCPSIQNLKIGLGVAYNKLNKTDLALKELVGEYSLGLTPIALNNRGLCYMKHKNYQKALDLFIEALIINRDSLNSVIGMTTNYLNIGKVQTYLGHFRQAESNLNLAFELIKTGNFPNEKINYYENIAALYKKKEDWKKAYQYTTKAELLKDSLRTKELDELQNSYFSYFKIQEKDRLLNEEKLLSKQLQLTNEKEKMKSNKVIWVASLLAAIVFIITYFSVRLYLKKRRLAESNIKITRIISIVKEQKEQLKQKVEELQMTRDQLKTHQKKADQQLERKVKASQIQKDPNQTRKRESVALKEIVMISRGQGEKVNNVGVNSIKLHVYHGHGFKKKWEGKIEDFLIDYHLEDAHFIQIDVGTILNMHYINSLNEVSGEMKLSIQQWNDQLEKFEGSHLILSIKKRSKYYDHFLEAYDIFRQNRKK